MQPKRLNDFVWLNCLVNIKMLLNKENISAMLNRFAGDVVCEHHFVDLRLYANAKPTT